LQAAQNGLDRLRHFIYNDSTRDPSASLRSAQDDYKKQFIKYISDDFNIPQAFSLVPKILKSDLSNQDKLATILDFDKVFGLNLNKIENKKINIPDKIQKLIEQRKKARENKNFRLADELRDEIEKKGFLIEDSENYNFTIKKI